MDTHKPPPSCDRGSQPPPLTHSHGPGRGWHRSSSPSPRFLHQALIASEWGVQGWGGSVLLGGAQSCKHTRYNKNRVSPTSAGLGVLCWGGDGTLGSEPFPTRVGSTSSHLALSPLGGQGRAGLGGWEWGTGPFPSGAVTPFGPRMGRGHRAILAQSTWGSPPAQTVLPCQGANTPFELPPPPF